MKCPHGRRGGKNVLLKTSKLSFCSLSVLKEILKLEFESPNFISKITVNFFFFFSNFHFAKLMCSQAYIFFEEKWFLQKTDFHKFFLMRACHYNKFIYFREETLLNIDIFFSWVLIKSVLFLHQKKKNPRLKN